MADSEAGIGGEHARSIASSKTGVTADTSSVRAIASAFTDLIKTIKATRSEFKGLIDDANKAAAAMKGAGSGPNRGISTKQTTVGRTQNSSKGAPPSGPPSGSGPIIPPAGGGPGGFMANIKGVGSSLVVQQGGKLGAASAAMSAIGAVAQAGVAAMDRRIDENMAYALPADRLSMVQQQQTGLSQNQVANRFRKPLTNYKLGDGGLNALLSNQVRYGVDANKQAAGYEAMRATSGYSLSTPDLVTMQNNLMSAPVANRMFALTGGTNFNKMGGGAADMFQSFQKIGKLSGLGNERILKGASQQGSAVRANLANLGLDSQAQDLAIQYAQENLQFKKKGGKGDYDPSKKADRKRMGVEDNFANQSEETKRVQGQREENMYRRQADNYAQLEKSNQALIKALGKVEDKLSGLIGARASTRPWQNALGGLGKVVGGITTAVGFATLNPGVVAAGMAISTVGGVAKGGDGAPANPADVATATAGSTSTAEAGTVAAVPTATPATAENPTAKPTATPAAPANPASSANDDNIRVPVGWKNDTKSLTELKSWSTFAQLKPILKDRLLRAFREHPALGIGEGWRSIDTQRNTFLQRYRKTDTKTKDTVEWEGSNWIRVSGAPAAPPGQSMHEIGLAADLKGDLNWWQSNAARFGLKTFAQENGEPWHTQPSEYPTGRGEYEKGVAKGKFSDGSVAEPAPPSPGSPPAINIKDGANVAGSNTSPNPLSSGRGSLGIVDGKSRLGLKNDGTGFFRGGGRRGRLSLAEYMQGFGTAQSSIATTTSPTESSTSSSSTSTPSTSSVATSSPPSVGASLTAPTVVEKTSAQITQEAFAAYSKRGVSPKGVLAPKEVDASKGVSIRSSGAVFAPKPIDISGDPMSRGNTPVNAYAIPPSVSGDPMPIRSNTSTTVSDVKGPSAVHINSSPHITMPMNFTFNGTPGDIDIRKIALQVRNAIKSELDTELMRTR